MKNIGIISVEESLGRLQKWQKENKDTVIQPDGWVKVAFAEGDVEEHLFVKITMTNDQDRFLGEVDNDPVLLTSMYCGDFVVFGREVIEDYLPPVDFLNN